MTVSLAKSTPTTYVTQDGPSLSLADLAQIFEARKERV